MSNLSDFISAGGGKLRYQEFTSSGTFTPSATLIANGGQCFVEAIGGGGSGGAARTITNGVLSRASGGDAGTLTETFLTVSAPVAVTIGAGGAAASVTGSVSAEADGNAGSATSFGGLLSTPGGAGGNAFPGSSSKSARGGDGVLGLGQYVTDTTTTLSARGGKGKNGKGGGGGGSASYGDSHMTATDGGGAGASSNASANLTATSAANNSGAGGGGATLGNNTGTFTVTSGAGGSGWCRISWFE